VQLLSRLPQVGVALLAGGAVAHAVIVGAPSDEQQAQQSSSTVQCDQGQDAGQEECSRMQPSELQLESTVHGTLRLGMYPHHACIMLLLCSVWSFETILAVQHTFNPMIMSHTNSTVTHTNRHP